MRWFATVSRSRLARAAGRAGVADGREGALTAVVGTAQRKGFGGAFAEKSRTWWRKSDSPRSHVLGSDDDPV